MSLIENNKVLIALLIPIIATGAFLRLHKLGEASQCIDEIRITRVAGMSLGQIFSHIPKDKSPLYYYMLHFVEKWGTNDVTVRLPAAILGILSTVLFYFLARQLLSAAGALIATVLFTFSPLHIYYCKENSPYSLYILLTLLNVLLFWQLAVVGRNHKWPPWLLLTIVDILYVYTHNLAFIFILIELYFLLGCFRWAGEEKKKILAKNLQYYLVHLAALGIAIAPLYWKFVLLATSRWRSSFPINPAEHIRLIINSFTCGYIMGQGIDLGWLGIFGFLLGSFYLWNQNSLKAAYVVSLFWGSFAITLVIYYAAHHWLSVRYFLSPFVIYLMGLGEGLHLILLQASRLVKASACR